MKVKTKLKGHQKRITGLAFSHVLNILVSSGADSQVKNFNQQPFALCSVFIRITPSESMLIKLITMYLADIKNAFFDFMSNSCVYGARMDGKSKQINSFRCQMGEHQPLLQILVFNFIQTRHIYLLFMKLKQQYMRPQNWNA